MTPLLPRGSASIVISTEHLGHSSDLNHNGFLWWTQVSPANTNKMPSAEASHLQELPPVDELADGRLSEHLHYLQGLFGDKDSTIDLAVLRNIFMQPHIQCSYWPGHGLRASSF